MPALHSLEGYASRTLGKLVEDHPARAGQICVFRAGAPSSAGQLREAVDWFDLEHVA